MFQTHYAKQRPKVRWEEDKGPALSVIESLLYDVAQENVLFTKEKLYSDALEKFSANKERYNGLPSSPKSVDSALEELCKKGYIKEIHGIRIAKFLSSF